MTKYFLGIDAGGTKTHAAIMNSNGSIVGFSGNGCGNWERVGLPAVVKSLHEVIDQALATAKIDRTDISSATFAMAGIDWDSDAHKMSNELARFGFVVTPSVMNDAYAVLFAGTTNGVGCASIAGTGGKTVAHDGKTNRATLGMSLGEGGGAGHIVADGLQMLARMHHGQYERTSLMDEILKATGFTQEDALFEAIARDHATIDESIAPLFFDAATNGDSAALEVVTSVARQHAWDVVGLADSLDFSSSIPLVRAGGLHTANSVAFNAAFDDVISASRHSFDSTILQVPPVAGSLMHAAQHVGISLDEQQRETLFHDALQHSI
jgi:N-acetylglucosamine kinase-like BadF-type ATPase